MTTFQYIRQIVFPAAFSLLPKKMDSAEARFLVFLIGLHESMRYTQRTQMDGGPAHGFWQFELDGIKGILTHMATRGFITLILRQLSYDTRVVTSYEAIKHNDILACVYARLNLWWHSKPLPAIGDIEGAWAYYRTCWNPGEPELTAKPRWVEIYPQAVAFINANKEVSNG